MDKSVDPCDNFYLHSCGNWIKQNPPAIFNPIRSHFEDLDDQIWPNQNGMLRNFKNKYSI